MTDPTHEPKHALRDHEAELPRVTTEATPVDEQREELAETVAALAAKLDVPTRVSDAAKVQTDRVQVAAHDGVDAVKANPQAVGAALVGTVLAVVVVVLVRRRRRRAHPIARRFS